MTALVIALAWFVLLVVGLVALARQASLALGERITNLSLVPSSRLQLGDLQAIRGTAASEVSVEDPVLGVVVAYYDFELRREGQASPLLTRSGGNDFVLVDDGGSSSLHVEPSDLAVPYRIHRAEGWPSDLMRRLLLDAEREVPPPAWKAHYELKHRAIAIGDPLTVVGVASEGPRFSASNGQLHVSAESLASIQHEQRRERVALNRLIGGAALIGLLGLGVVVWLA